MVRQLQHPDRRFRRLDALVRWQRGQDRAATHDSGVRADGTVDQMANEGALRGAAWGSGVAGRMWTERAKNMKAKAMNLVPRYVAEALFKILDDIDTAGDIAKGDDAVYRRIVERLQKNRFEVARADGYRVFFLGDKEVIPGTPADRSEGTPDAP